MMSMFHVLGIGKAGLHAHQYKVDALAEEVANINTDGYKVKKVRFQELLVDANTSVGSKAMVSKTDFSQGSLRETGKTWDLAVEGSGLFGVMDGMGNLTLTRSGAFRMEDGILYDDKGNRVFVQYVDGEDGGNAITPDSEALDIPSVSEEGILKTRAGITIGRILLFTVQNPQELIHLGEGRYAVPEDMILESSLDEGANLGKIRSGFLENSNGNLVEAMTDMIVTQRAYSLNSEALRATDELMKLINDMKR